MRVKWTCNSAGECQNKYVRRTGGKQGKQFFVCAEAGAGLVCGDCEGAFCSEGCRGSHSCRGELGRARHRKRARKLQEALQVDARGGGRVRQQHFGRG